MIKVKVADRNRAHNPGMTWPTRLLCLLAALSLALVPAVVAARTVHGPVTEMVICGDGGAQPIRLDARGNPVDPGQCCDCLQCLTLAAGLPQSLPPPTPSQVLLPPQPLRAQPALPLAQRHLRPVPRGPPLARPGMDSVSQARLSPAALEFGQVPRGKAVARTGQTTEVAR